MKTQMEVLAMSNIKTFLFTPSGKEIMYLRRYAAKHSYDKSTRNIPTCPGASDQQWPYHNAMVYYGMEDSAYRIDEDGRKIHKLLKTPKPPKSDRMWPVQCELCNYQFHDDDHWQLFSDSLYVRADTGEEIPFRDAPVGAVWEVYWMSHYDKYVGADGKAWSVKTPGGEWHIDGIASNCDIKCKHCNMPRFDHQDRSPNCTFEQAHPHKCWVRHGEAPDFTVDKDGITCGAGAGSILVGGYHGFFRNGYLVPA
jgi:hypothetical protein